MRGTRRPQPGLLFPSPCLSGDARKPLCLPPRITDVREPSERKPCGEAAGRTGVRSRGRTAGALSPTCLRPARPLRVPTPAGSAGSSAPGTHSARSLLSPPWLRLLSATPHLRGLTCAQTPAFKRPLALLQDSGPLPCPQGLSPPGCHQPHLPTEKVLQILLHCTPKGGHPRWQWGPRGRPRPW